MNQDAAFLAVWRSVTFLDHLAPDGHAFLPELQDLADAAVAASGLLGGEFARAGRDTGGHFTLEAIDTRTRDVASIDRSVQIGLSGSLITPIDRHDISELSSRLQQLVPAIDRATRFAVLLHSDVEESPRRSDEHDGLVALTGVLERAVQCHDLAIACPQDSARSRVLAGEVLGLTREGNRSAVYASVQILGGKAPPMDALRSAAVYHALAGAITATSRVGRLLERSALKRV